MPDTQFDGNIEPLDPSDAPQPVSTNGMSFEDVVSAVRAEMRVELDAVVADVERRLSQAREIEAAVYSGVPRQTVHAEDLNIGRALIDGYTVTANSPSTGYIAWANLHVVLAGIDYTIGNGNTDLKYSWFVRPATYTAGTALTLQSSNTMPTLGPNDALIFVNNAGTPVSVLESSITYAVGPSTIGNDQISGGIAQDKISGLATALGDIGDEISRVEAKADGAVTQHFGPDFPWAAGTVQDAGKTGDVYTAQNSTDTTARPNGQSWRWSGANGSPANTWILIEDAALSKALADAAAAKTLAQGKTTVYYRTVAQGAPPTPTEGFAAGDEWVQTDKGNYTQRWTGSAWAAVLYGNDAIGTGISGTKIGSGINAGNVNTGTLPIGQVPQIGPTKLNVAQHFLY